MRKALGSLLSILMLTTSLIISPACAKEKNGFDTTQALIPENQIFSGGPDKDGIPAIDKPVFIKAREADFLKANDRILGIEIDGISKAYPIRILNWHEIVNDKITNTSYTVTYCPLCGTGMAFNSSIKGETLSFGVSGLLYNSDVLLYDRQSESLWSQILAKAVTGKHKGTELVMLPLHHTTWFDWKRHHPSTSVLSTDTGYWRNYNKDPYGDYKNTTRLIFPVFNKSPARLHPKENVLGLAIGNTYKAYPFIELNKQGSKHLSDSVNNTQISVHWNQEQQSGYITDDKGKVIPIIQSYWFAWYAFHPETEVFEAAKKE